MAIPKVSRNEILSAISDFHQNLRTLRDGWHLSRSQKYALVYEDAWYPPKQIISMATNTEVGEFNGGESPGSANPYLRKLGFEVIDISETIQWINCREIMERIVDSLFEAQIKAERNLSRRIRRVGKF